MNRRRTSCLILLTMLPLFLTTGCWGSSEVDELALELAWGIDEAKNKGVLISAQVIIPSQISSVQGQGGGSGGGQGKSYFVVNGIGRDTLDAVQQMQTKLSRQVFRGHRRIIVIGEPLARKGIKNILDTYTRDPNLKLRSDVFIVRGGTAKNFLEVSYPLEKIPGLGALQEYDQTGTMQEMGLINLMISAASEGSCVALPVIAIGFDPSAQGGDEQQDDSNANGFHIAGTGIFNKDLKLLGFLNVPEGRTLRWIKGQLRKLVVTANIPEDDGYVSMDMNKIGSKIQPMFENDKVKIRVKLTGQGMIRENNTGLDLTQTRHIALVKEALEKHIEEQVLRTIQKVQKEFGADVFGFGETIHRKHLSRWKTLKNNWNKEFREVEISVKADLSIRRIGVTGASLQLEEDSIQK
ncbi:MULTISPECIES: Ger(x)C family spore germination protein [Paenibacillus]|uniref:Ger(x)C family spore germination protein n=1 Tax=Paenibacillus TaxID=44249 RepID=UPI002FE32389